MGYVLQTHILEIVHNELWVSYQLCLQVGSGEFWSLPLPNGNYVMPQTSGLVFQAYGVSVLVIG